MSNHRAISNVITVVLILVVWIFGWLLFYPFNPLTITAPLSVSKQVVSRGECVNFQLNAVKHMDISPEVTIDMVNSVNHLIMTYTPDNPPGDKFPKRAMIVPYTIHPGKYMIKFTARYPVALQTIKRVSYSDWIEVK